MRPSRRRIRTPGRRPACQACLRSAIPPVPPVQGKSTSTARSACRRRSAPPSSREDPSSSPLPKSSHRPPGKGPGSVASRSTVSLRRHRRRSPDAARSVQSSVVDAKLRGAARAVSTRSPTVKKTLVCSLALACACGSSSGSHNQNPNCQPGTATILNAGCVPGFTKTAPNRPGTIEVTFSYYTVGGDSSGGGAGTMSFHLRFDPKSGTLLHADGRIEE